MRAACALRISSGRIIFIFGIAERLRTLRYPIFTGGVHAKKPRRADALRGGVIQLLCNFHSNADGNIGLAADGLCANA